MLPTQYLTEFHPPTSAADFIGDAHRAALAMEKMVASAIANDYAPIRLFYAGPAGVGKTALAIYLAKLLSCSRWAMTRASGVDLDVDVVRELAAGLNLCHNDLFGTYRLFAIHEADKIPERAQVRFLEMLDLLPKRTAVICTSNMDVNALEDRFQSRFKWTKLGSVSADDMLPLLAKFNVPPAIAKSIAMGACGNVRTAMNEAEEYNQTQEIAA